MSADLDKQRNALLKDGFVIVRGMISPGELESFRASSDAIVDAAPSSSRVVITEWVDQQSADVLEFLFSDRAFGFTRDMLESPDAAPLGMWILCSANTGWHRDIHPFDMAPLDGLQEDIRINGPPYLQWNIALCDDPFLHVVPGSHLRRNSSEESKIERSMGLIPLTGTLKVDLKAGDGVIYINNILHAAANSESTKRRTLHLGYQAFGGRGFSHFYPTVSMCTEFLDRISTEFAELCRHFDSLHETRREEVIRVLLAILDRDEAAYAEAIERIHPSRYCRMVTAVVLSKTAYLMRKFKNSDERTYHNGPDMQKLTARFSTKELEELWCRFAILDRKLQADEEIYEPLFQSGPTRYFFYEMPEDFGMDDFVNSWGRD